MPESLLRCFDCKKTFKAKEAVMEKIPNNFCVITSPFQTSVPTCPHCGAAGFLGFAPAENTEESQTCQTKKSST